MNKPLAIALSILGGASIFGSAVTININKDNKEIPTTIPIVTAEVPTISPTITPTIKSTRVPQITSIPTNPIPTPITDFYDMTPFTEEGVSWKKITKTEVDNINNEYTEGYLIAQNGTQERQYFIDGEYTKFSGTIALKQYHKDLKSSVTFRIDGDGTPLYTITDFKQGSFPENFDIDITGIKILTIHTHCDKSNAGGTTIFSNINLK